MFEWRNGAIADLGKGHDLRVAGPFAAYLSDGGTTLVRRNVSTGSTLTIASGIYNAGHDVAADGDVVYTMPDTLVYRFQDGTGSAPISPPNGLNYGPVTDGSSVVYRRRTGQNPQTFQEEIELFDGANTITLAGAAGGLAIANGWVAFTRLGSGGQWQIWTRSPGGEERQVTFLGVGSSILGLGPGGEVVFFSAGAGILAMHRSAVRRRSRRCRHQQRPVRLPGRLVAEDHRQHRVSGRLLANRRPARREDIHASSLHATLESSARHGLTLRMSGWSIGDR